MIFFMYFLQELMEIVDFLKAPDRFVKVSCRERALFEPSSCVGNGCALLQVADADLESCLTAS